MVFDDKKGYQTIKSRENARKCSRTHGRVNLLFFEGVEMCFMIAGFQFLVEPISQLQD